MEVRCPAERKDRSVAPPCHGVVSRCSHGEVGPTFCCDFGNAERKTVRRCVLVDKDQNYRFRPLDLGFGETEAESLRGRVSSPSEGSRPSFLGLPFSSAALDFKALSDASKVWVTSMPSARPVAARRSAGGSIAIGCSVTRQYPKQTDASHKCTQADDTLAGSLRRTRLNWRRSCNGSPGFRPGIGRDASEPRRWREAQRKRDGLLVDLGKARFQQFVLLPPCCNPSSVCGVRIEALHQLCLTSRLEVTIGTRPLSSASLKADGGAPNPTYFTKRRCDAWARSLLRIREAPVGI